MTNPTQLPETFRALLLTQDGGSVRANVTDVPSTDLPAGEVTVRVETSDLNYKDGLAIMGKLGIRKYPMIPGIDFSGTVLDSQDSRYRVGDNVTLTGWGVGERHWGGYAELARVQADWLVHTPKRFSAAEAMAIGTAGLTAMLCVMALEEGGRDTGHRAKCWSRARRAAWAAWPSVCSQRGAIRSRRQQAGWRARANICAAWAQRNS